uniref:Uncharacterized protein n=1 Tax=Clytia hemisphaerica TaxID=252671 RepID=A0A7M5WQX7_9CNID
EPRKHAHYEEDHQQTYATLEGDGFHPQGYQTLTDHRSSITSTRSMIPTEEGGFYQQGYQTLTNHRNSVTSIREVIPEESGFYQQGYQTLTNHRASINSIREVIPEEDGFQQQGYQTLTNHRNSVNSIQEVIPEEGGFHSQSLKGQRPSVNSINNVILEEGRFHSQNVKGQRPCVNSTQGIINTNVSEENEEPVENEYFETEEIYHDPNDFDFKNTSNQEKKENDLEPFYFQTDIAVQSHQHIRPNLNLPLHTRNYANDEEIYVNNDPFESPVEENGPYAYSTVNKAWITPDDENNSEIVNNDFETDFNSFTIV